MFIRKNDDENKLKRFVDKEIFIEGSVDISCLEFSQLLCHPSAGWGLVLKKKLKM